MAKIWRGQTRFEANMLLCFKITFKIIEFTPELPDGHPFRPPHRTPPTMDQVDSNPTLPTPEVVEQEDPSEKLLQYIRSNVIGDSETFKGPFGRKKIVRCDSLYGGGSLRFIEDHLALEVSPYLSNDSSTTTVTGLQSTMYYDEVKNIIRKATNASNADELAFFPPLRSAKHQTLQIIRHLIEQLKLFSPIVIASVHIDTNILRPLVEIGADILVVPETDEGRLDVDALKGLLETCSTSDKPKIGLFKVMSEVTGVLTEDLNVTAILHLHGALAIWDYTEAGPGVNIDVNPQGSAEDGELYQKDVVFFNVNNFVGGLQSNQVLIIKKHWLAPGGHNEHANARYSTPELQSIIRTGLAVQLKEAVTAQTIMKRTNHFNEKILTQLFKRNNVFVLGPPLGRRGCLVSFVIKHTSSGLFLHHNYICALLNDLFGIQARSFDVMDHSYAKQIFSMDQGRADSFVDVAQLNDKQPFQVILPGFVQVSLPWYFTEDEVDFVANAIVLVAQSGWTLLPQYIFTRQTGEWHHQINLAFCDRKCLTNISYDNGTLEVVNGPQDESKNVYVLHDAILKAKNTLGHAKKHNQGFKVPNCSKLFSEAAQRLRWFLLPSEAKTLLGVFRKFGPPALDRLVFRQFKARTEVIEVNPVGTLAGNVQVPECNFFSSLDLDPKERKKRFQRGCWLQSEAGQPPPPETEEQPKQPEQTTGTTGGEATEPDDMDNTVDPHKSAEMDPKSRPEAHLTSFSAWFKKKVGSSEANHGDEKPSPVSQVVVKSAQIPIEIATPIGASVGLIDESGNVQVSHMDPTLRADLENAVRDAHPPKMSLEAIPEENEDSAPRSTNPSQAEKAPELFFDQFMNKWSDSEAKDDPPPQYFYGLEQHQSVHSGDEGEEDQPQQRGPPEASHPQSLDELDAEVIRSSFRSVGKRLRAVIKAKASKVSMNRSKAIFTNSSSQSKNRAACIIMGNGMLSFRYSLKFFIMTENASSTVDPMLQASII
eukprot:maker-scaffold1074_size64407-snap-gene-0.16 protein:Tk01738 transcript:maker-scaffold1074_size64407-snap-gene-0.16-mRNA-1 annotation:"PREDICTED: uncharacterized protein LOC100161816"